MTKNDIINLLTEICSYAKGTATEESDMDINVDMPSGFDLYYDLKEFLEKTFQKEVDFGLSRSMRSFIKSKVCLE